MNLVALQVYGSKKVNYGSNFVSKWNTSNTSSGSSTATQIKLPLASIGGTYNFLVDWGDGTSNTITVYNQPQVTHTYASPGIYTITISGTCTGWVFNNIGDKLKLLSILNWGSLKLGTNQGSYFSGCTNLTLSTVSDVLNLTGTTSLSSAFRACTALTAVNRMNEWNVSNVTSMNSLFLLATNFNQPIGNWNVINVNSMSSMFSDAIRFNQPISSWNMSNVTILGSMFSNAASFNQPIGNWNTVKVSAMANLFRDAISFNQDISNWSMSVVINGIGFMAGKSSANFSAAYLDNMYNAWAAQPVVVSGLTIDFGTIKYTAAGTPGKNILLSKGWIITDGGI